MIMKQDPVCGGDIQVTLKNSSLFYMFFQSGDQNYFV